MNGLFRLRRKRGAGEKSGEDGTAVPARQLYRDWDHAEEKSKSSTSEKQEGSETPAGELYRAWEYNEEGETSGKMEAKPQRAPLRRRSSHSMDWLKAKAKSVVNVVHANVESYIGEDSGTTGAAEARSSWAGFGATGPGRRSSWSDLYNERCEGNLVEFQKRVGRVIETIGELSLAGDQDPMEGARLLVESSVKDDITAVLSLLNEEDRQSCALENMLYEGMEGGEGDEVGGGGSSGNVAYPCLEYFLEARVIKVFCQLGIEDRPVGTMAYMLGTIATLLTKIRHPLLPSASVHYPVGRLIHSASNYMAAKRTISAKASSEAHQQQEEWRARSKRVTHMYLAYLLQAVWRRLREDSAHLDFFLAVDRSIGHVELEIFTSLLPLLQVQSKTGLFAQQACLVAVSVSDPRSALYIARHTTLCQDLAVLLAKSWQSVVCAPPTDDSGCSKDSEKGVVHLLKHLRFAGAVGMAAALRKPSWKNADAEVLRLLSARTKEEEEQEEEEEEETDEADDSGQTGSGPVGVALVQAVRSLFLEMEVGAALLDPSEALAAQAMSVTERIVRELGRDSMGWTVGAAHSLSTQHISPVLRELLAFLFQENTQQDKSPCSGTDFSLRRTLLHRVESQSTELSMAAMELLSTALDVISSTREDRVLFSLVLGCPPGGEGAGEGGKSWGQLCQALEGMQLNSDYIDQFCRAFPGSPIHPDALATAQGREQMKVYMQDAHRAHVRHLVQQGERLSLLGRGGEGGGGGGQVPEKAPLEPQAEVDEDAIMRDFADEISAMARQTGLLGLLLRRLAELFNRPMEESVPLSTMLTTLTTKALLPGGEKKGMLPLLRFALFGNPSGGKHISMASVLQDLWRHAQDRLACMENATSKLKRVEQDLGVCLENGDGQGRQDEDEEGDQEDTLGDGEEERILRSIVFLEEMLKEVYCSLCTAATVGGVRSKALEEFLSSTTPEEEEMEEEASDAEDAAAERTSHDTLGSQGQDQEEDDEGEEEEEEDQEEEEVGEENLEESVQAFLRDLSVSIHGETSPPGS